MRTRNVPALAVIRRSGPAAYLLGPRCHFASSVEFPATRFGSGKRSAPRVSGVGEASPGAEGPQDDRAESAVNALPRALFAARSPWITTRFTASGRPADGEQDPSHIGRPPSLFAGRRQLTAAGSSYTTGHNFPQPLRSQSAYRCDRFKSPGRGGEPWVPSSRTVHLQQAGGTDGSTQLW